MPLRPLSTVVQAGQRAECLGLRVSLGGRRFSKPRRARHDGNGGRRPTDELKKILCAIREIGVHTEGIIKCREGVEDDSSIHSIIP